MWTIALSFLKSPKNILIAALAVALVVIGLYAGFYKWRTNSLSMKLKTTEITALAQAEQIEQYARLINAIKAHEQRIEKLTQETGVLSQRIGNLKIEGKCVKDESYYKVADDIAGRFNSGLQSKGSSPENRSSLPEAGKTCFNGSCE